MSGYDFSPLYRSSLSAFSPGSTFLATAHQNRLIVRSVHNLSIVRAWDVKNSGGLDGNASTGQAGSQGPASRSATIDEISWSDDGLYILVVSLSGQTVWVYGIAEEGGGVDGEVVRIQPGPEGLEGARWAKGGREVICWSEHYLRVTIHDISERTSSCIDSPKGSMECHTVDPHGRYLAILESHNSSEYVGIYDLQDGCALVRHFPVATSNAQTLEWSPCGRYIALAESWLSYQLYIYSPIGPLISAYPPIKPDTPQLSKPNRGPNPISKYKAAAGGTDDESSVEHMGLGIKCLAWCPSGRAILVGGWEGTVEIVDPITGRCLSVIEPKRRVGKGVAIWQEPVDWLKDTRSRGIVQFDRLETSTPLPSVPANLTASPPSSGPTHLLPSPSGAFLALSHTTQPRVVHVYALCPSTGAMPDIKPLGVMILREGVRDVSWACKRRKGVPAQEARGGEKLMVVSKSGGVFVWDKDGWVDDEAGGGESIDGQAGEAGVVEGVGIPNTTSSFAPNLLHVSPDGRATVIQGRKDFCVMYDDDDAEDAVQEAVSSAVASLPAGKVEEKAWESEGLSLVMETEEEEEENGEGDDDVYTLGNRGGAGRQSDSAHARARGGRMSVLQEPAWRPLDVRA